MHVSIPKLFMCANMCGCMHVCRDRQTDKKKKKALGVAAKKTEDQGVFVWSACDHRHVFKVRL